MKIERKDLIEMIHGFNKTSGFFSVLFIKKDGSLRKMTCKRGVKKHLANKDTPIKSTTSHIKKYVTVYDIHSKGYRNINLETISQISTDHKTYEVTQ